MAALMSIQDGSVNDYSGQWRSQRFLFGHAILQRFVFGHANLDSRKRHLRQSGHQI